MSSGKRPLIPSLLAAPLLLSVALGAAAQQEPGSVASWEGVFPLSRAGDAGDSTTYRISRENLTLGRDGSVLSVIEVSGVLVRTLADEVSEGAWSESVRWRTYRYGQSLPGATNADPRQVDGAHGVRYVVDPRELYPPWFDVPAHRMEPGPAATLFSVLVLDAWSWDGLVYELRRAGHDPVRIGERYKLAGWTEASELGSESTGHGGRYRLGAMEVSVVGISACGSSERCLRLGFTADGNEVVQDLPGMNIAGREYFVGTGDFSLEDGHLVSGELWGPLIATFTMNGAPAPISGVLQRVTISEITP